MQDDDIQDKGARQRTHMEKAAARSNKDGNEKNDDIRSETYDPMATGEQASFKARGQPRVKCAATKADIAEQIGIRLRSVYDDVLAQPVPERFLDLLRELERAPTYAPAKKGET